ncbi:Oidioi.mRNA.OKI2018_I69.XSR.g16509.t1.cds [Oikopleura dioica]|uniref:Oidioi.mRNA.OKI2018_I69.XSR.g16509.t1.cds n=1 Tax=Oikopleura dioica TaxID=34765 RepID=A0ABN7SGB7_OIKDI|nr:Oidioi.mRNA.OKI2018_I69.XSR.g16509.t1.cds [Oikopleura dioica]
MKLTGSVLAAMASADVCGDCDANIAEFNAWHAQSNIICSRYTHPRDYAQFADPRAAACKDCKVQCVPDNATCPGTDDLEAGFWNKTALKLKEQYVNRAEIQAAKKVAEKAAATLARNLTKEKNKYDKIVNKLAEKKAKSENKAWKESDWESWRENRRQENEAKRAQRKQEKKDAKAAAKALKELRKQQRLEKRALADKNKVLFAFYAELEEHYDVLCPEMHLIQDNQNMARKFNIWKQAQQ